MRPCEGGARRLPRVAAWLAGMLAAGCAPAPPAGSLVVAVPADITGIYPSLRDESFSVTVSSNLFEALTRFDRDLAVEPGLAERWEAEDERTWSFELEPGLLFSDGTPVRSADVAASLEFARGPGSALRHTLQAIESVTAMSERRVRIRTRIPFPVLPSHLTSAFVLKQEALRQNPVPAIGTGAYRLERWTPGRELRLSANPRYRGPAPGFDLLRFVVIPEARARVAALLAGDVQIADSLPPDESERLRRNAGVRVVSRPGLRVLFLAMRMDAPPFRDPRLREALDLALDRGELIARALRGAGTPASQIVPPSVMGFNPSLRVTAPDRERARTLLREAGFATGLELTLDGPSDRYVGGVEILNEVARQLGEVGVRVVVRARPKQEFFAALSPPGLSFYLFGWACEAAHAGDALNALMHTPHPGGLGFENSQSFSDPELDRMIEAADLAPHLKQRARLLAEALARVAELRPVLPLLVQTETMALSRDLAWEPPLDMGLRLLDARPAGR